MYPAKKKHGGWNQEKYRDSTSKHLEPTKYEDWIHNNPGYIADNINTLAEYAGFLPTYTLSP